MQDTPNTHIATGQYNPYNGAETLKIMFKRIWDQCEKHQDFAQHIAYTKFNFEFTLVFNAEAIVPTVIKGKSAHELRPTEATITVTGTSAPAPDDGRREAGLFVPAPTLTQAGLVDIPLQAQNSQ
jgi:hypothetical protein